MLPVVFRAGLRVLIPARFPLLDGLRRLVATGGILWSAEFLPVRCSWAPCVFALRVVLRFFRLWVILPAAVPAGAGLRPCLVVGRLRMLLHPAGGLPWGGGA